MCQYGEKDISSRLIEIRINELIEELSQCREDERNGQSSLMGLLAAAATALAIFFGATYLMETKSNYPIYSGSIGFLKIVTFQRVMFWSSSLIFVATFCYVVVIAIGNTLRYFYVQHLEERLHIYFDGNGLVDEEKMGCFLHYPEYAAPIITLNPKHISSSHTMLNFLAYWVMTISMVSFCLLVTLAQFIRIEGKGVQDYVFLTVVVIIFSMAIFLFLRLNDNARTVANFSMETAKKNLFARRNINSNIAIGHDNTNSESDGKGVIYSKASSFGKVLMYLFLPRRSDPQKAGLILIPLIIYAVMTWPIIIQIDILKNLAIVFFVFEFLVYQARYQINDMRGLKEDKEANKKNRFPYMNNPVLGHSLKVSFIVSIIRLVLAALILFAMGMFKTQIALLLCCGCVIVVLSTILYEYARKNGNSFLIYILVGVGYPLRFFMGLICVDPSCSLFKPYMLPLIFLSISLWAYGSFASVLVWTNEICKMEDDYSKKYSTAGTKIENNAIKRFKKKHYNNLWIDLERYACIGERKWKDALRYANSIFCPWNVGYVVAVSSLIAIPIVTYINHFAESCYITTLVICFLISSMIYIFLVFISNLEAALATLFYGIIFGICASACGFISNIYLSIFLCMYEALLGFTYIGLRFMPEFKPIHIPVRKCVSFVVGEYAADEIFKMISGK